MAVWACVATGCASATPAASEPTPALWAILINGGRRPAENYQSHLLHVRQALRIVSNAGIAPERTALFMSDGSDPAADVAVRERTDIDDFWRVSGTRAENALRPPIEFVDSQVEGIQAMPATRETLRQWLAQAPVRSGDTVLLYVTDHGNKNPADTTNNSITLWGDQDLSVNELREILLALDPGVRVVSVMSQCFSGSFSHLGNADTYGRALCGYFSSTAERPAYGCYAENRGRENVGHSFHFLGALSQTGDLVEAHNRTLVADDTPDVPLRTSDAFLHSLLERVAAKRDVKLGALVDELLAEAWKEPVAWEAEIRLLDRIAHRFGYSSPRSLAQLQTQTKDLPDITDQLRRVAQAWKSALRDDNVVSVERFLATSPQWKARLQEDPANKRDIEALRRLGESFIGELAGFTKATPAVESRLELLHSKSAAADAVRYRMEVRLAALLRLETLLTTIAGRKYIAAQATTDERARYEQLIGCETLTLAPLPGEEVVLQSADFPPFDDDVAAAQAALPSYIGIQFRTLDAERRKLLALNEGAAMVMAVYPDTPAARAGIESGDIVVGHGGQSFTQANEIRLWSMLAPAGQTAKLQVLRESQKRAVELTPGPYPLRWPELPGPPKLSSAAPALRSVAFRGQMPQRLAKGKPHLLFFWATWCTICKTALPELLAFEKQRKTKVIAITDEPAELLNKYFESAKEPFPQTVVIDRDRRDFGSYGVSGSPTFVLIDKQGRIEAYTTGYSKARGLAIPGWKWP